MLARFANAETHLFDCVERDTNGTNVKLRPAWLMNAEVHLFDCVGRDLAAPTRTSDIAAGSLVWSQCSSGRRT